MRLFDRLTGPELLEYVGRLHGLPRDVSRERGAELLDVLDLSSARGTMVVDHSAGMTKKTGLACALVHGPRLLVLDEPFEAVDPVSAATIRQILRGFVAGGGTVVMSSHVMALVEQLCDHVAVISEGRVLAAGRLDDVRGGQSLEERFVSLVGGHRAIGGSSRGCGLLAAEVALGAQRVARRYGPGGRVRRRPARRCGPRRPRAGRRGVPRRTGGRDAAGRRGHGGDLDARSAARALRGGRSGAGHGPLRGREPCGHDLALLRAAGRRARDVLSVLAVLGLSSLGLVQVTVGQVAERTSKELLDRVVGILAWTPLGAA